MEPWFQQRSRYVARWRKTPNLETADLTLEFNCVFPLTTPLYCRGRPHN